MLSPAQSVCLITAEQLATHRDTGTAESVGVAFLRHNRGVAQRWAERDPLLMQQLPILQNALASLQHDPVEDGHLQPLCKVLVSILCSSRCHRGMISRPCRKKEKHWEQTVRHENQQSNFCLRSYHFENS